jgi:hypothetical protein
VREGFGGVDTQAGELAPMQSAAAVRAAIETRAILAERNPRDEERFRERLLRYCKHPDFAEAAIYKRKVGRKRNAQGEWEDAYAENFSIRFIEAALPIYRNVYADTTIRFEDARRMIVHVEVYDSEANVGYAQDATLPKLVERRDAADRVVVGERMNSENKRVYIVEATRDEMRNVFGAERSKLLRDQAQKLLPFHILIEARRLIEQTNADENAKDPDAAKKKVLDRFASIGVSAEMLKVYLDRGLDTLTLKDLAELGVLHNGLREGEFTWADVMRMKDAPAEGEAAPEAAPDPKAARLKDQVLAARTKAGRKPEEP